MLNKVLIQISCLLLLSVYTSALFWGSSDESTPPTRYYYQKRGPQYTVVEPDNRPIPSVPMQVPLQAQFAPYPYIQNVQLVPCLCPVSQENLYEQQQSYENVYVGPNFQAPPLQQNIPPRQPLKP